jgi:hypothetical protein
MPIETPSDGLDLSAMRLANSAVEAAAARSKSEALSERLAPAMAGLDPALRPLLDRLIGELGRVEARAEAAHQAATELRRSRGDWLRIDPLRHIPEGRATPPPPPPSRIDVSADDPAFFGFGWHPPEGSGQDSWRWSGLAPAASVVLPSLGAGVLSLRLDFLAPFGQAVAAEDITLLANGEPLSLELVKAEGNHATLSATWQAAEDRGAGSLALVILGPVYRDSAGTDTRALGLGIRRVVAEHA